MLFALRNKHKAFLLRLTSAQRSSGCEMIDDRRANSLHQARPDQNRNSRLS
jgi:hypothetical protein